MLAHAAVYLINASLWWAVSPRQSYLACFICVLSMVIAVVDKE